MPVPRALQIGHDIGSYRLIRLLGEGGMGAVYEVVHQGIGRRAAMKFLTLDTKAHPELTARFVNEARAANRIAHPGVVQVYEFGQLEDGTPWMLMEFLEGETLSERLRALRRAGQVFGRDGLLLLHQLASVLNAAHSRGIVHRDLKPGNIMLVPDPATAVGERVKLLDFGIAKLFDVSLRSAGMAGMDARTRTGAILGTPAYMAPEQCMSAAQIDGQADVYAVGVIAYQMVTGRLPHDDEHPFTLMAKKLAEPAQPMGPLGEDLPSDFPLLVGSMIETKPADRPRIEQVEDTLARMLGLNPSRRSGFLGRAASPDQQAAAALPPAPTKGPTSDRSRGLDSGLAPHTAPTVDAPAGEAAVDRSLPSPPWLAESAGSWGATEAATLVPRHETMRLTPEGTMAPEPTTASAPVPMAPVGRRPRAAVLVGLASGLLIVGAGLLTVTSWHRSPHAQSAPMPSPTGGSASSAPELPKELPVARVPDSVAADKSPALPTGPGPESAGQRPDCALTPSDPSCGPVALPSSGPAALHGKSPAPRGTPRAERNLRTGRPGEGPGHLFLISGATVPEQEAAIRMCAKANLGTLRKLNERSVIKLQRSGTLQVISAPPAVLKSNLDECLRQLLLNIPAKSLPEEVTIRITR